MSKSIYITNHAGPNNPHRTLLDRIPYGKENAVSMCELADNLNTTQRRLRLMIERARIDGNIIAGTRAGLYVPQTDDELREYVRCVNSRIKTASRTIAPAATLLGGTNQ